MRLRISCDAFTVAVTIDQEGIITEAAPLVKTFIGQSFVNLLRWAAKRGGLEWGEIE